MLYAEYVRQKIRTAKKELLPASYQSLEYIEGTGEQYINTGVTANNNTKVEVTFRRRTSEMSSFENIFGMRTTVGQADDNNGLYVLIGSAGDNIQWIASNITASAPKIMTDITKKHTIVLNTFDKSCVLDGNETYSTEEKYNGVARREIFLFERNQPNFTAANAFKGIIYSAKIWKDDVLLRDFVPCIKRKSGEAGMYDIVTGVFYGNNGTGTFLKE